MSKGAMNVPVTSACEAGRSSWVSSQSRAFRFGFPSIQPLSWWFQLAAVEAITCASSIIPCSVSPCLHSSVDPSPVITDQEMLLLLDRVWRSKGQTLPSELFPALS